MTSTPPNSICNENLADSWVELYYSASHPSTPPLIPPSQIEKLLLEAQRESNNSSLRNSGYASPRTPKSVASSLDRSIHESYSALPSKDADPNEWLWDWSGRPDSSISVRDSKYGGNTKASLSLRHSRMIRKGALSEIVPLFVFSNIISILLGAGIGLFFGKRLSSRIGIIGID